MELEGRGDEYSDEYSAQLRSTRLGAYLVLGVKLGGFIAPRSTNPSPPQIVIIFILIIESGFCCLKTQSI
jgi:hypothetical protein